VCFLCVIEMKKKKKWRKIRENPKKLHGNLVGIKIKVQGSSVRLIDSAQPSYI